MTTQLTCNDPEGQAKRTAERLGQSGGKFVAQRLEGGAAQVVEIGEEGEQVLALFLPRKVRA